MRIGRTLPPAAAPIGIREIASGFRGIVHGQKELDRFCLELKEHFGVKHCFLVSSGKAALTLILLTLKELFPARDEVLIPAFTCYSVPSSIVRAGLKVRLCDLQPDSLDFDFAQLSTVLSETSSSVHTDTFHFDDIGKGSGIVKRSSGSAERLLAVIPTHLFGFPADVPRLRELIRDPEVTVVEDAAQAMGETCKGKKLGILGDVSFFSLGRGKAFSTVEGGIILTDRDDIAEKLKCHIAGLPSYGLWQVLKLVFKALALALFIHPRFFWLPRSMPFLKLGETLFDPHFPILGMSSFQAGLASNWQAKLQKLQDVRKRNVKLWIAVLEDQGSHALGFDHQVFGLIRFPIRVGDLEKRELLLRESTKRGLGIMPVYPDSIDGVLELKDYGGAQQFLVAKSYAGALVTLPTHDYLTQKDITKISGLLSRNLPCQLFQSFS